MRCSLALTAVLDAYNSRPKGSSSAVLAFVYLDNRLIFALYKTAVSSPPPLRK
jgi:hypothetical protein